jgi:coatomer subunit beta
MATSTAASWTIVHQEDASDHSSDIQSLKNALEKGSEDAKLQTMQKILVMMLNGDPLPGILMHVIRFVLSTTSKRGLS